MNQMITHLQNHIGKNLSFEWINLHPSTHLFQTLLGTRYLEETPETASQKLMAFRLNLDGDVIVSVKV